MKNVYHNMSKIHGIGVFSNQSIIANDLIGVSHAHYQGYWYMTTHGYYNHSENPNCIIQKEGNINLIIAKKDIPPGEELTVDYREQPYLEQPRESWKK